MHHAIPFRSRGRASARALTSRTQLGRARAAPPQPTPDESARPLRAIRATRRAPRHNAPDSPIALPRRCPAEPALSSRYHPRGPPLRNPAIGEERAAGGIRAHGQYIIQTRRSARSRQVSAHTQHIESGGARRPPPPPPLPRAPALVRPASPTRAWTVCARATAAAARTPRTTGTPRA